MIIRISKASPDVLDKTAGLIGENETYMKEAFPECSNKAELLSELRKNSGQWNILYTDVAAALFTLQLFDANAVIDEFYPVPSVSSDALIPSLVADLKKSKIQSLTLRVLEQVTEGLQKNGFERRRTIIKLAAPVIETKLMPILPLAIPTERDIPVLAKLMHESYQKSAQPAVASVSAAEGRLRGVMHGSRGAYAGEASLMTGAIQNIVSACFVTLSSPRQAHVAELFTHPLYRARGLATIELATAMNRLLKQGVQTLAVQVSENDEIAGRLFAKLGFKQQGKLAELVRNIQ